MTLLLSCANCAHNGLQTPAFGGSTGYCTRHKAVLHASHSTTCGQHLRKDLLLPDAQAESALHATHFVSERIVTIRSPHADARRTGLADADRALLQRSPVGRAVIEYAALSPKILFLSQLRGTESRAEVARNSLARGYVASCMKRGGVWTSGLHLLKWTKDSLPIEPEIDLDDLPERALPHSRQRDLVRWDILMLRLVFVSDIGFHAPANDPVAKLRNLPEQAARATNDIDFSALMKWASTKGWELIDRALPLDRYATLAQQLHDESDPTAARSSRASEPLPGLDGRGSSSRRRR